MDGRLLVWAIDATCGFDTAWVSVTGSRLYAKGRAAGLTPEPYWVTYSLETEEGFRTRLLRVETSSSGDQAHLELACRNATWTVNGQLRPDLDGALDCDLAACPLTNTMPVLRRGLLAGAGDYDFLMAYVDVPSLQVRPARQRYTHVRRQPNGEAVVRYQSGSFESELTIDADGFVLDYPGLGRRLRA